MVTPRYTIVAHPADTAAVRTLQTALATWIARGQLVEDAATPDVAVVLVSAAYVAEPRPLPTGAVVVPIILEPCEWPGVPGLDRANAFPRLSPSIAESPDAAKCWARAASGVCVAGELHLTGGVSPKSPKVEAKSTRVAFMLAAVTLMLAGPVYAWFH